MSLEPPQKTPGRQPDVTVTVAALGDVCFGGQLFHVCCLHGLGLPQSGKKE